MSLTKCTCCQNEKEKDQFYKNKFKENGLESHCKECVLRRKAERYKKISLQKRKNKYLRLLKKVNVLDLTNCTFKELWINRPKSNERLENIKLIFEELL